MAGPRLDGGRSSVTQFCQLIGETRFPAMGLEASQISEHTPHTPDAKSINGNRWRLQPPGPAVPYSY